MTDYQYYKSMGICPYCRKAKPMPGKVYCYACKKRLDKNQKKYRATHKRVYKPASDEDKQRRNAKVRATRKWRKEHGICVRCGHAKATREIYCDKCYERSRRYWADYSARRGHEPATRDYIPQPDITAEVERAKHTASKIDRLPEVVALWNAGWTYEQIKIETRLSLSTIAEYLKIARAKREEAKNGE